MTDKPATPDVFVTDTDAPEGCMCVHDRTTGTTVVTPATQDGYRDAIDQLSRK